MNERLSSAGTLERTAEPRQGEVSSPQGKRVGGVAAFFGWLGHALPTLLVLSVLGGLAYWGHHTGWSMPKFSEITGNGQTEAEDWCAEHSVPESLCVACNHGKYNGKPVSTPKDYGWCPEHGVHQCPLCHPDVVQVKEPPQISAADLERTQRGLALRERPRNNNRCPLYTRLIQFASLEAMEKAGVDIALAEEKPITEVVTAPGEITYDQTRVARLSSRAAGTVWQVDKQVGDLVRAGEILALVDAAEVGRAKAEFLQAYVQVNLKNKVLANMRIAQGAVSETTLQEAEAALQSARVHLLSARQGLVNLGLLVSIEDLKGLTEEEMATRIQLLGLPQTVTGKLDPQTTTANLLLVKAPFDGIVAERQVVVGEVVDTGKTLFVVADTRQMWVTLDVRQEDVKYVALGQPVQFRADGSRVEASGKVTWMSTSADEKTRTVKVRADLANPDGQLRASTFGTGHIVLRQEPRAVVVPSEAVQWDGSCHVVFVRDKNFFDKGAPKLFHTRTVRPGVQDGKHTEIIAGLWPGEVVAARGSGVLRSELLKNNLGAG
jgi:cobalt-zinc-cadmium efflux system membrane fusion protein